MAKKRANESAVPVTIENGDPAATYTQRNVLTDGPAPIHIDPKDLGINVKPAEPEESYWVGVIGDCPLQAPTVGGQDFPKITEIVRPSESGGVSPRIPQHGQIIKATKSRVAEIVEHMKRHFVRAFSNKFILVTIRQSPEEISASVDYNPATDVPLAKYAYMIPLGARTSAQVRASVPVPMAA